MADFFKNPYVLRALAVVLASLIYAATKGKVDLRQLVQDGDFWLGLGIGTVAMNSPINKGSKLPSAPTSMFVLALCLSSCTPQKTVDWPRVLECGTKVTDIITTVTRILLQDGMLAMSPRSREELLELGRQHGGGEVACAVQRAVNDFTGPGAAITAETGGAAARGLWFLDSVGVEEVYLE